MDENIGFWEQAVNKIVTVAISRQLKQANGMEAQIKTDLNKLAQGQLDSIAITIYGVLLASQVEAESLRLQIGQVTVKPLSALRGKIKLVHPSTGTLHLVINQEKLTIALNSDSLLERLRSHQGVGSNLTIASTLADGVLTVSANPPEGSTNAPLVLLVATPEISPDGKAIRLQQVRSLEAQALPSELTQALLTHMDERLNLSDFERQGVLLQIQQLNVSAGKLSLHAVVQIEQFPSS